MNAYSIAYLTIMGVCALTIAYLIGRGGGIEWTRKLYDRVHHQQHVTAAYLAMHLYQHGGIEAVDEAMQDARTHMAANDERDELVDDLEAAYRKPSAKRFGGTG